jgi:hypothetical protein
MKLWMWGLLGIGGYVAYRLVKDQQAPMGEVLPLRTRFEHLRTRFERPGMFRPSVPPIPIASILSVLGQERIVAPISEELRIALAASRDRVRRGLSPFPIPALPPAPECYENEIPAWKDDVGFVCRTVAPKYATYMGSQYLVRQGNRCPAGMVPFYDDPNQRIFDPITGRTMSTMKGGATYCVPVGVKPEVPPTKELRWNSNMLPSGGWVAEFKPTIR